MTITKQNLIFLALFAGLIMLATLLTGCANSSVVRVPVEKSGLPELAHWNGEDFVARLAEEAKQVGAGQGDNSVTQSLLSSVGVESGSLHDLWSSGNYLGPVVSGQQVAINGGRAFRAWYWPLQNHTPRRLIIRGETPFEVTTWDGKIYPSVEVLGEHVMIFTEVPFGTLWTVTGAGAPHVLYETLGETQESSVGLQVDWRN